MSNTPHRTMRIPDDLWDAALAKAKRQGTTVTAVVVRLLWQWVNEED